MANRNRSPEKEAYWRWHEEMQASGSLSIRGYCRKHGLSEPSFHAWRRELKKRDAEQSSSGNSQSVSLAARSAGSGRIRSHRAGHREIAHSQSGRAKRPRETCSQQPSVHPGLVALEIISAPRHVLAIEAPGGVVIRLREEASVEVLQRVITACQQTSLVVSDTTAARREVQSC